VAANFLTSSCYRAELVAIRAALEKTLLLEGSVAFFTDSRYALQVLQNGFAEQSTLLGTEI
jgi:ribonuclease HI